MAYGFSVATFDGELDRSKGSWGLKEVMGMSVGRRGTRFLTCTSGGPPRYLRPGADLNRAVKLIVGHRS